MTRRQHEVSDTTIPNSSIPLTDPQTQTHGQTEAGKK